MTPPSASAARLTRDHASRPDTSTAREAIAPAAPWIERLARVGYAAKALLYLVVGGVALQSALGDGGRTIGARGALVTLVRHEYGAILLLVVAIGLFGYATWQIIEALLDPERRGATAKALAVRAGYLGRGVIHAALGLQAARLAAGSYRSRGQAVESWTARALDAPLGAWLVMAAGVAVAAYGCYQLYRAWAAKLGRQLDLSALSPNVSAWVTRISRFGIGARGVVFVTCGAYLVRAGMAHNASTAADTGEALGAMRHQPFGPWVLAAVAIGLIAYAAYEVVQARYRVIRPA